MNTSSSTDWLSIIKVGVNGKISAMRVAFLFVVLVVMLNWSWVNFHKKTDIVDLPKEAATLIVGLGGAMAVQKFAEKKTTTTTTNGEVTAATTTIATAPTIVTTTTSPE